jgi:hypothetical protein
VRVPLDERSEMLDAQMALLIDKGNVAGSVQWPYLCVTSLWTSSGIGVRRPRLSLEGIAGSCIFPEVHLQYREALGAAPESTPVAQRFTNSTLPRC